jgi:lipopolysaccharide export system permease protein
LRIIDRYVLLEAGKLLIGIVGVLLLISVSMLLLRTLEEVNLGALNAELVGRFLGLQVLRDVSSLLPPAFFLAALLALGRMARDSELIAIAAGGMGPWTLYRGLGLVALPLTLATAWLSLDVQPWAATEIQRIRALQTEQASQVAGLQAGRFYQQEEGKVTLFIGQLEGDRQLRHLFIQDNRGPVAHTVLSDSGRHWLDAATGDRQIELIDGRRYDGNPGMADFTIASFDRYLLRIEAQDQSTLVTRKRSTVPTQALLGTGVLADRAELEHRLSSPLAILCLALIAVPLSETSPRQRGTGRMFLAFLTYFAFFNLQRVAEGWFEDGVTPVWLGSLWYQALVLVVVYLVLLSDSYWVRRLWCRVPGSACPGVVPQRP